MDALTPYRRRGEARRASDTLRVAAHDNDTWRRAVLDGRMMGRGSDLETGRSVAVAASVPIGRRSRNIRSVSGLKIQIPDAAGWRESTLVIGSEQRPKQRFGLSIEAFEKLGGILPAHGLHMCVCTVQGRLLHEVIINCSLCGWEGEKCMVLSPLGCKRVRSVVRRYPGANCQSCA